MDDEPPAAAPNASKFRRRRKQGAHTGEIQRGIEANGFVLGVAGGNAPRKGAWRELVSFHPQPPVSGPLLLTALTVRIPPPFRSAFCIHLSRREALGQGEGSASGRALRGGRASHRLRVRAPPEDWSGRPLKIQRASRSAAIFSRPFCDVCGRERSYPAELAAGGCCTCGKLLRMTFSGGALPYRNYIRGCIFRRMSERAGTTAGLRVANPVMDIGAFWALFGRQGGEPTKPLERGSKGGDLVHLEHGYVFWEMEFIRNFLRFEDVGRAEPGVVVDAVHGRDGARLTVGKADTHEATVVVPPLIVIHTEKGSTLASSSCSCEVIWNYVIVNVAGDVNIGEGQRYGPSLPDAAALTFLAQKEVLRLHNRRFERLSLNAEMVAACRARVAAHEAAAKAEREEAGRADLERKRAEMARSRERSIAENARLSAINQIRSEREAAESRKASEDLARAQAEFLAEHGGVPPPPAPLPPSPRRTPAPGPRRRALLLGQGSLSAPPPPPPTAPVPPVLHLRAALSRVEGRYKAAKAELRAFLATENRLSPPPDVKATFKRLHSAWLALQASRGKIREYLLRVELLQLGLGLLQLPPQFGHVLVLRRGLLLRQLLGALLARRQVSGHLLLLGLGLRQPGLGRGQLRLKGSHPLLRCASRSHGARAQAIGTDELLDGQRRRTVGGGMSSPAGPSPKMNPFPGRFRCASGGGAASRKGRR